MSKKGGGARASELLKTMGRGSPRSEPPIEEERSAWVREETMGGMASAGVGCRC